MKNKQITNTIITAVYVIGWFTVPFLMVAGHAGILGYGVYKGYTKKNHLNSLKMTHKPKYYK